MLHQLDVQTKSLSPELWDRNTSRQVTKSKILWKCDYIHIIICQLVLTTPLSKCVNSSALKGKKTKTMVGMLTRCHRRPSPRRQVLCHSPGRGMRHSRQWRWGWRAWPYGWPPRPTGSASSPAALPGRSPNRHTEWQSYLWQTKHFFLSDVHELLIILDICDMCIVWWRSAISAICICLLSLKWKKKERSGNKQPSWRKRHYAELLSAPGWSRLASEWCDLNFLKLPWW